MSDCPSSALTKVTTQKLFYVSKKRLSVMIFSTMLSSAFLHVLWPSFMKAAGVGQSLSVDNETECRKGTFKHYSSQPNSHPNINLALHCQTAWYPSAIMRSRQKVMNMIEELNLRAKPQYSLGNGNFIDTGRPLCESRRSQSVFHVITV